LKTFNPPPTNHYNRIDSSKETQNLNNEKPKKKLYNSRSNNVYAMEACDRKIRYDVKQFKPVLESKKPIMTQNLSRDKTQKEK